MSSTHFSFLGTVAIMSSNRLVKASCAEQCPIGVCQYLKLPCGVIKVVRGLLSSFSRILWYRASATVMHVLGYTGYYIKWGSSVMGLTQTYLIQPLEVHSPSWLTILFRYHHHACAPFCCLASRDWFYDNLANVIFEQALHLIEEMV